MDANPTRRSMLRTAGTVAGVGVAGCAIRYEPVTESSTPTGETYSFSVENRITRQDLESYPPIDGTPPAEVSIAVEANPPDGSEQIVFERDLELPPATDRQIEDAFTTKADGTGYIVKTKLGEFQRYEAFGHTAENHSAGHRFTPGGYGDPTGTTFSVVVTETKPKGQYFKAKISLQVPGEEE